VDEAYFPRCYAATVRTSENDDHVDAEPSLVLMSAAAISGFAAATVSCVAAACHSALM